MPDLVPHLMPNLLDRPARTLLHTLAAIFWLAAPAAAQTPITVANGATLEFTGRLHSQFAASSVEGAGSTFFTRRARITVELSVNELLDAKIQPEYSGGGTKLKDAWVRFNLHPSVRVSFGQLKRAFDLIDLSSSTDLSTIERDGAIDGVDTCSGVGGLCSYSRLSAALEYGDRDQGVLLELGRGPLRFMGTVTNGGGTNTDDTNAGKSFAGRLAYDLGDALTIGGGVSTHDYLVDAETEYGTAWNVDVDYGEWRDGPHLQAGLMGGDNWLATGSPDFLAWHATGTWYFPLDVDAPVAGWEPLLRIGQGDPDVDTESDGGVLITPGAMLYIAGKNKVGFNLDVYAPDTGSTEYSLKFQTFLHF